MAHQRIFTSWLWLAAFMLLAGCSAASATAGHTTSTGTTPTTATTSTANGQGSPTAIATAGLPCRGGEWNSIVTNFQGIPLPPLTVAGAADTIQDGDSWNGTYLALCSGGTLQSVETFTSQHMTELGWSYTTTPASCVCSGAVNLWSNTKDKRLVYFEPNPNQFGGHVVWGISVFTPGN
jgi:hypothetical protein